MRLTTKQAAALKGLVAANGVFPMSKYGTAKTGCNTTVLGNLAELGLIEAEGIYLRGHVKGLKITELGYQVAGSLN